MATDQPDFSDGCMIALYPPPKLAAQLHIDNGLDVDDLHCTVVYLGDAADVDVDKALVAVEALADRAPILGSVSGHGRFTGVNQDVLVALVDAPALEQLRRDTVDALIQLGISFPREHGYTAHITIQYVTPDTPSPVDRLDHTPVTFGALVLVHGTNRYDFPFKRPDIAPYAAEAFAAGWAATRAPLGERFTVAAAVAVGMARDHADQRDVLEATLKLGSLHGTWAELYDRREQLYTSHTRTIMAAWWDLAKHLDIPAAVRWFRDQLGLTETDDRGKSERRATALAAARRLLEQLAELPRDTPAYVETATALAEALRVAEAEGVAGGYAIAAQQIGVVSIDFDIAFKEAWDALRDLDMYWAQAKGWLADILHGLTKDVGRELARLAEEDASYDDMVTHLVGMLGTGDVRAVETMVDLAMGQSFSRGAITVYARAGARTVDYITAGGPRVCPVCQKIEAENPYPLLDVPVPPRHPACRCNLQPADPLEALDVSRYVPTGGES